MELFRRLEIGWPLCQLCHETPGVWDELFAYGLHEVQPADRLTLVQQTPSILAACGRGETVASEAEAAADEAAAPAAAALPVARTAVLPGARADGTIGLWLEKKSPARGKGWQRRWFVVNPQKAEMHYFADPASADARAQRSGEAEQDYVHSKGHLELSRCVRITSNNFASGHFELHFPTKVVDLRVEDKERTSLGVIEQIFNGLHLLGCLAPENDGALRRSDEPVPKAVRRPPSPVPRHVPQVTVAPPRDIAPPAVASPQIVSPTPVVTRVPGRGSFPKRAPAAGSVRLVQSIPAPEPEPEVVTSLPGARQSDGAVGIWLEKKSPAVMKGWQRRWCIFSPQEKSLLWFSDPSGEQQRHAELEQYQTVLEAYETDLAAKKAEKSGVRRIGSRDAFQEDDEEEPQSPKMPCFKQIVPLDRCVRLTSSNFESGHFELHFSNNMTRAVADAKLIELRVEGKSRANLVAVEELLMACKGMGLLAGKCDGRVHAETQDEKERRFIGVS